MGTFKLTEKQVSGLVGFLKVTRDKREHTRALAVLNRHKGMLAKEAAESLHVTPVAVSQWTGKYTGKGIEGLKSRKPPGRPPLVKERAKRLIPKLLKEDPMAFGFLKGRWVLRDIAKALNEEGVPIKFVYVGAILRDLGLVYKRPKAVAKEDDPSFRRKRKEIRNYKKIAPALVKKGSS